MNDFSPLEVSISNISTLKETFNIADDNSKNLNTLSNPL
jgi:hypothetical protein